MKKITLLAFILASFLTNAQIVLSEDFESSAITLPATWTNENLNPLGDQAELWTIGTSGDFELMFSAGNGYFYQEGGSGNYAIFNSDSYGQNGAENVALSSPVFDCSSLTTIKLSFVHFAAILDPSGYGSNAYVEVFNGTQWVLVAEYSPNTVAPFSNNFTYDYGEKIIDVSTELAGVSNAQVRFRSEGDWGYGWQVDNIVVQQPQGNAPGVVTNLVPADGATGVEILLSEAGSKMIMFSWNAPTTGDPATSYNWVFGTTALAVTNAVSDVDGTVEGGSGITWGTTVDAGWQTNTTYFWKVESVNVAGITETAVYSFTTGADDPLGINDVAVKSFKAFPNPVIDIVTIEGNTPIDSVEIVNQLGQSVLEVDINSMFNNQINLSKLNTGIYFVKVKSASKTQTLQVLKQ
jgi:hypothetical protein